MNGLKAYPIEHLGLRINHIIINNESISRTLSIASCFSWRINAMLKKFKGVYVVFFTSDISLRKYNFLLRLRTPSSHFLVQ